MPGITCIAAIFVVCSEDFNRRAAMRCRACDKALTEFESTRKSASTGEFIDLCNDCFKHVKEDMYCIENPNLESIHDLMDLTDEE